MKLSLDRAQSSGPSDTADIKICFNWEKYVELQQELPLGNDSVLFYEDVPPKEGIVLPEKSFQVGFSEISKELIGKASSKNMVALGLLEGILDLSESLSRGTDFADEIAAIGMALGASLTGAKSMTATTGPGLDLMTEMIGLASNVEIPVVIVDVQRGGPATGIPAKLEQSDISHAIYGGHGDAPRVVLAAYDLEGCYRLVIESFNISERYQTPVILLSDQRLGQTTVAVSKAFLPETIP